MLRLHTIYEISINIIICQQMLLKILKEKQWLCPTYRTNNGVGESHQNSMNLRTNNELFPNNNIKQNLLLLFIYCTQQIYNYIPETNHNSRLYKFAAIL